MVSRREALKSLAGGAALGLTGAAIVVSTSCVPTDAPAAEFDPMLDLVTRVRSAEAHAAQLPGKEADAYHREVAQPLHKVLWNTPPLPTTLAGVAAVVGYMIEMDDMDDGDLAVLKAISGFFAGRAA